MWLLERLAPDHKTIADFRRHNGGALVANCAAFVQCAPSEGLAGGTVVAIDRSKVKPLSRARQLVRRRIWSANGSGRGVRWRTIWCSWKPQTGKRAKIASAPGHAGVRSSGYVSVRMR